jgi:hypothetical protein
MRQSFAGNLLMGALVMLGPCPWASAALLDITDLFNTGVDNARVPLPDDAPDPHYTYATPPPTGTVPLVANSANGFPVSPGGPWMGDNGVSAWLVPAPDTTGNAGDYTYRTTFTVPAGVDPSQVYLTGRWSSDNAGVGILINGSSTGITGPGDFTVFTPQWAIGRGFVNGTNTLDFVVNEATGSAGAGGFTGVRVEMAGKYTSAGRVAIPGLKNSGTAVAEGSPLSEDAIDPGVALAPGSAITGPTFVATSAGGFPIPPWTGDSIDSAWLTPAPDTNGPDGNYFYQMAFDLTGLDVTTVEIYGRWATDNTGSDILLNGLPTGNVNSAGFGDWTDFTLSPATGESFLPGVNTLTFNVVNAPPPGPTGVRFEFMSATALIPEPGSAGLVAMAAGLLIRRRRATRPCSH